MATAVGGSRECAASRQGLGGAKPKAYPGQSPLPREL
jgi:hypothetical protein